VAQIIHGYAVTVAIRNGGHPSWRETARAYPSA
jgi:hypothetical protein